MAKNNYTIAETFELPSKGKVYNKDVNPQIKLRAMTAEEEMKRLTASDTPYKILSDIIEDCLVEGPNNLPVYQMCLGDYQFLLHKLRTVTYGADYKMRVTCPICHGSFDTVCNLDDLQYFTYDDDFEDLKVITLPVSGQVVELNLQTPQVLDNIARRKKEIINRNPEILTDPEYLLQLASFVKSVDGQVLNSVQVESYVRKLHAQDANYLLQKGVRLNERVGLNTDFNCTCKHCGYEMVSSFWMGPEFFRPTVD